MNNQDFFVIKETEQRVYPFRPADVHFEPQTMQLLGTFGKQEVELAAYFLVRFFISRGGWVSFCISDLVDFYRSDEMAEFRAHATFGQAVHGFFSPFPDDSYSFVVSYWQSSKPEDMFVVPRKYFVQDYDHRYYPTSWFVERLKPQPICVV